MEDKTGATVQGHTVSSNTNRLFDLAKSIVLLALFILFVTFACRYWHRDFLGNLAVALLLAVLVQSLKNALIFSGVLITMFQLGNALKLSVLGTPASPDDFYNIQNIFFLTDGWRQAALFFIAAIPFILAIVLIPWKRPITWLAISAMTITGIAVGAQSYSLRVKLDEAVGNSVWNQPANFRHRGLALHLAQETIRTISKVDRPPESGAVDTALSELSKIGTQGDNLSIATANAENLTTIEPARNVHVFVLESFFDPVSLGEQWVPEDPFPAKFRELWAATGNSTALSPVFGGYTANAEFEMLCGFPVTRNAVFFEGWLRRSAPCLPRVLSEVGYDTIASHPNVPGFWNRTNAYQLIGFDKYRSKSDFDLSDSVGSLLMDHSMYDQAFDYIRASDTGAPVFNYMLTYHGHLPYPSSDQYPDKVKAGKESVLLHGYLNQLWYKSRALVDRLEALEREDPNALIVIFGDHLPFLGPNYGVYTEAWNLPKDRSDFSGKQLKKLTSTPLIVIDGERGPLSLGKLPLYRLPSLVTSLLGYDPEFMFDKTQSPASEISIRPVYGTHYTLNNHSTVVCTEAEQSNGLCETSTPWLQQVEILIGDIFTGKQFSLNKP